MNRIILAAIPAVLLAGCSEQTQESAQTAAESALADTQENAEVVGEELRDGAIVAADGISEGASDLSDELTEDDANDADRGDGELDGAE